MQRIRESLGYQQKQSGNMPVGQELKQLTPLVIQLHLRMRTIVRLGLINRYQ